MWRAMTKRLSLGAIAAALLLVGGAGSARADLALKIYDGNGTLLYQNSLGTPGGGTLAASNLNIGEGYTVSFVATSSNAPNTNPPSDPTLQLGSFSVNSTGADASSTLKIVVSGTDFTPLYQPTGEKLSANASANGSGLVGGSFVAGASTTNTLFAAGTLAAPSLALPTTAGGAFSYVDGFAPSAAFSMTDVLTLQFASTGGTIVSAGGEGIVSTPEPATMAMVVSALPLLGLGRWLRRRSANV